MENNIQIFNNPEFGEVRTLLVNDEPYFVGKDVALALGYGQGKSLPNAIANHVDAEDKGVTEMMTPGGNQQVTIINESGLYSLIMSSKLPSAKKFKRWVTSEVLPSIRKHGGYMVAKEDDTPETIMARAVLIAQETINKQKEQIATLNRQQEHLTYVNEQQRQEIASLTPDAQYTREVLTAENTWTATVCAKYFGYGAERFNKKLKDLNIQFKQNGVWVLKAPYQDKGYTKMRTYSFTGKDGRTYTKIQTEWTEEGRRFLSSLRHEGKI